ncbi:hypothetical protein ACPCBX_26995 [Streptomyces tuirus]|uniref:Uncharacterized protein n=1 Tax=Streptomyces tuirus TaxID=68278 RepID=A0A7G1NPM8_9ACTN|nr:hypothetical protein [Streptomyces tuirus]BCL23466.1 hypothetical protein GCM10017668_53090 [Streptomyces tuirus]
MDGQWTSANDPAARIPIGVARSREGGADGIDDGCHRGDADCDGASVDERMERAEQPLGGKSILLSGFGVIIFSA